MLVSKAVARNMKSGSSFFRLQLPSPLFLYSGAAFLSAYSLELQLQFLKYPNSHKV